MSASHHIMSAFFSNQSFANVVCRLLNVANVETNALFNQSLLTLFGLIICTLQPSRKTQNPRVRQGQILVMVENCSGHDKNWFAVINRLPRWFNLDPSITCP